MGKHHAVEIGKGWKRVSRLATDEILIAKTTEIADGRQRFFWLCLDFAHGRSAELPVKARLPGGDAPVINRRTNELIFSGEKGIVGFSLKSRQERLIIPIDAEYYCVKHMWLSDEDEPRLLYLVAKQDVPSSELRARYDSGERQPYEVNYRYSLHSAKLDSSPVRLVADFQAWPVSMAIDWNRGKAIVFLQKEKGGREREIVEVDLVDGSVSVLGVTPLMHVELSPKRTRLSWMASDAGIREALPDGREMALTGFGGSPSFSPDGQWLAFTVHDYEVWLKGPGDAAPEKIISLPAVLSQTAGDRVVWCPCGKHFAVCLVGLKEAQGEPHRVDKLSSSTFIVADCDRREIVLRDDLFFVGMKGDRVWIPAEVVADLCLL
ncbi:MAG: PD40 domain-containing protein [Elusimicrobia bacterium]|nr:PD40 domain-containing protein [Elusimicrobiota bacterium]